MTPTEDTPTIMGGLDKQSDSVQPEATKSVPYHWPRGNRFGETFKRFMACMQWAKEGKTYIYYHPDFVAIDHKTWEKIQRKLNPPKETIKFYYDEYDTIDPEQEEKLKKWLSQRNVADRKPSKTSKNAKESL